MIHDRRNTFGGYLEDFASGGTTRIAADDYRRGHARNEIQQLLIARRLLERYAL